ncbi:MAG TPA: class I SAM-dependent methyltransferase [Spirochaetota bacterium]|nr:class I SAM-dependent methyltransferase [Spirochaetota bacterium]HPJ33953.1 class I SAM-dependent methyltransferase [Spirochaetota bacterium]
MPSERIESLLKNAFERRSVLFDDPQTDCFRLFNSDGDGLEGVTVDFYAGNILIQYFSDKALTFIDNIIKCINSMTGYIPADLKSVLVKDRRVIAGPVDRNSLWKSRLAEGEYDEEEGVTVRQNGTLARADLVNGQNTGIFLDMREIRGELEGFYQDKGIESMINLFSYTALFSVHALMNGVSHAVNVDLSKGVLRRARMNYGLNGLPVDDRDFIYGDSMEWIKIFSRKNTSFDFGIFDPPTFARNRKKNFSVRKDYNDSLEKLQRIVPHGYVLTSINSYSVSEEEYRSCHPAGWELLMFANESADFVNRGKPYLKAGLWKI